MSDADNDKKDHDIMFIVPDVDNLLVKTNDILDFYMKFIPTDQLQELTLRNEDEKLALLISHFHPHHIYQEFQETFFNSQCLIDYENLCQEIQTLTKNLEKLLTIENLPTVVEELGEEEVNKLKVKITNIFDRYYAKSLQVGIIGMDSEENKIVYNLIKNTFTSIKVTMSLTARRQPAVATTFSSPFKYSSEHSCLQNSKDSIVFYNATENLDGEEMRNNQKKINVKFALSRSIVLILVLDATEELRMNRDLLDWIRKFGLLDQNIILVLTKMHLIPVDETKEKIEEIEKYVRKKLNLKRKLDVVAMNTQNLIILKRLFSHSSPYHLQLLKYLILENILNILKQRVKKDYEIIHDILMPLRSPLVEKRLSFCRNEKLQHHIKEIWIRSFLKYHLGYKETINKQIKQFIEDESLALHEFLVQKQHFEQLTNCSDLPTIVKKSKISIEPFFNQFLFNFRPLLLIWWAEFLTRINQNYHDFIKENLPFLEEKLSIEQPPLEMNEELKIIFNIIKPQFETYWSALKIGNNLERNEAFKKFVTSQVLNQNFIYETLLQPFGRRYLKKIENLTKIVTEEIRLLKKRSEEFEKSDISCKVPRELVALENYRKSLDKLRFYWIEEEFHVEKEIFDRYRPRTRHVIVAETLLSKFYFIPNNNNESNKEDAGSAGVFIVRESLSSSTIDWQTGAAAAATSSSTDKRGLFYAWDCLQKLNGNGKLSSNLLPIPKYLLQSTSMGKVSLYEVLFYPFPNDAIVGVYSLANYICNTVIPLFSEKQKLKFILNCIKQIVEILITIHQRNSNVVCYDMRPEAIFIIKTRENISLRLCEFANEKNPKDVDKRFVNYFPPEHLRNLSCFAESDVYNIGILIWQLYYFHLNKDELYSLEKPSSTILLNQPFDTGNFVHYSCASRLHNSHEIQPVKLKQLLFDCMRLQLDERLKLGEILILINEIQNDVDSST